MGQRNRNASRSIIPVSATVSYSCVQDSFPGNGNIDADPMFIATGDYHLQAGSPCIDAGDPDDSVGEESMPNGGRINMGAYGGTPHAAKTSVNQ